MSEAIYLLTESNRTDLISWLRQGKAQRVVNALENLTPKSLPMVSGEPIEYLLDGMRVKLNFNKMGNMTSLKDMEHDLQDRWVSFVGAENDKHLKVTSPQALTPITADDVTDEMMAAIHAANNKQTSKWNEKQLVADVCNVVIKHRSEAK